jgi:putative transposase
MERMISARRACQLMRLSRGGLAYRPRRTEDRELVGRIRALARAHPRYGYRRVWALLRREGRHVNVKRVHRIWKRQKLTLARRVPRKRWRSGGSVPGRAERPNHVWTYDFLHDFCENNRMLKILTVTDEFTRESLAIAVETRLASRQVIGVLERIMARRGRPDFLRSDNGPEFIAQALQRWLIERGSQTRYIEPGHPWQNAYAESFHGKLRDECLNREVFHNPAHARAVIAAWREHYNHARPHSSLGYRTPVEFRQGSGAGALPPHPRDLSLSGPPVPLKCKRPGAPQRARPDRMVTRVGAQVASQRCPILRAGRRQRTTKHRHRQRVSAEGCFR